MYNNESKYLKKWATILFGILGFGGLISVATTLTFVFVSMPHTIIIFELLALIGAEITVCAIGIKNIFDKRKKYSML